MEILKLTQDEIQILKSLQDNNIKLIEEFGIIEYRMQKLILQKEELKQKLIENTKTEDEIGYKLQIKYGDGNIDLEKGEFIKQ